MVSLNNKHYGDDGTHCGANVASLYEDFLTVVYPFSSKENPSLNWMFSSEKNLCLNNKNTFNYVITATSMTCDMVQNILW